ncbi:Putative pentatricopeptide repeat-containing protein At3g11460, mitochondrial [Linum perenne]
MYSKCGLVDVARKVFDENPKSRELTVCYNALIAGYSLNMRVKDTVLLLCEMRELEVPINGVTMLGYLRCGEINSARKLFDEIPGKGLITWNAMINGYSQNGLAMKARQIFDSLPVKSLISWTAIIGGYSKCGFVDVARQVFDENPQSKELTSCYNALISGYSMNLRLKDAVFLFCEMSELRVPIGNGLLSMYLRCGEIISGRKLFDEMPRKRLVTWNAIINGYAQNGLANDVLELYREMGSSGIHPNPLTLVGVLSSCANLGAHEVGMEVEMQTHARGFMLDPFLNSGLINMYARCGNLVKAREIFDGLSANNLVSWTAIIGSYGMHGEGEIAVELFDDMIKSGTRPDGRVFVNVLSACSHAGLTDKGLHYFDAMEHKYKLHPGPEHYSCMVDLLGRAGRLEEAHRLIKSMKAEPDDAVWGALLGACKIHRNVELAELAFERVIELEPTNIGYYVLLSNIYKDAGNSEGILRIRRMMRERKLKKDPGCSYVEFMGKVHIFLSGDKSHPQSKQIYKFLDELESEMKELDSLTTEGEKNIISDEEPKNIWRLSLVHEDS